MELVKHFTSFTMKCYAIFALDDNLKNVYFMIKFRQHHENVTFYQQISAEVIIDLLRF